MAQRITFCIHTAVSLGVLISSTLTAQTTGIILGQVSDDRGSRRGRSGQRTKPGHRSREQGRDERRRHLSGPLVATTGTSHNEGLAGFNQKHVLAVNGIWEIPFLKNRGPVSTLFAVVSGRDNRLIGGGRITDRPDVIGNPILDPGRSRGAQVARYFDTKAFVPNAGPGREGMPGNSGGNNLVGPGFSQTDMAVLKRFNLAGEKGRFEFRAEFFNLLNQVNFNNSDKYPDLTGFRPPTERARWQDRPVRAPL